MTDGNQTDHSCKVCGHSFTENTGSYPDQVAQEKGFCGAGCQDVDEKTGELDERTKRQEGH